MSLSTLGELKLRQVAGLPPADGFAFVPGESADEKRPFDDLYLAIGHSVQRPEVQAQQAAIAASNAGTVIAKNGLKPDLSVIADYSMLGLEERLDDSFSTLGDARFYEWTVGIRYTQPLYWRGEQAAVRKAEWAVAKQQTIMDQLRHVISHQVASAYQVVEASASQLDVQRERIRVAESELAARTELYNASRGQLEDLFDSQDRLLQARTDYQVTLTNHQKAITELNYASGMILDDQFVFADDPENASKPPQPIDATQESDEEAESPAT
jgi:outer membrane protein TolC